MRISDTPALWTYSAWTLANYGLDLPKASDLAGRTVTRATESLKAITASTVTGEQLDIVERLCWSWAALGVAARRDGDLATAERYLSHASKMSANIDIAGELGAVHEKQGRSADAVGTYLSARAIASDRPAWLDERLRRILGAKADLDSLSTAARPLAVSEHGASFDVSDPAAGTADFMVIIGPDGQTTDVKFLSGSKALEQYVPRPLVERRRTRSSTSICSSQRSLRVAKNASTTGHRGEKVHPQGSI